MPIGLSGDFSKQTLQAGRGWKEVFEVMKGKALHPRLLYLAKLSFRMEGQIKCFPDKVKFKEFIFTKPLLCEMLKELSKKRKIKNMNSKMATNYQQLNLKKRKQKLSKQLEQEQNHRNGYHMEGFQWGGGGRIGGRYRD